MMASYIEASQLPTDEKVYLKKDFLGWRVVHPLKNEDGSWNWFNLIFGSKSNLVFLIVLLLIGVTIYLGYHEQLANFKEVMNNPCNYCNDCQEQTRVVIASLQSKNIPNSINFSDFIN